MNGSELEASIGQPCLYFDEDKLPHAGIIAHVHKKIHGPAGKPICNLAIYLRNGRVAARRSVEPAYHDGTVWRLVNKWAHHGIVPKEEYEHIVSSEPLRSFDNDGAHAITIR